MGRALDVTLKVIPSKVAVPFVKAHHYSGKVVNNSSLHFGAFLDGKLHGVMSFGPSMDKSKIMGLVEGTGWSNFLELNRMAFDDVLPRNSESRCISLAMKALKKHAPQVKWVVSFADGCSCGDGTIYRASNFILTDIRPNKNLVMLPDGTKIHKMTLESSPNRPRPELGGGDLLRRDRRTKQLQEVRRGRAWHGAHRIPASLHLLHRQAVAQAPDRSRDTVLAHRRTWCGDVSRRARDAGRAARGRMVVLQ